MKPGELQKRIGLVIRTQRAKQHISQEAFADKIRMHRTYYGALERGEKNLQLSTLKRVSDGLGIRMSEVLERAERAFEDL